MGEMDVRSEVGRRGPLGRRGTLGRRWLGRWLGRVAGLVMMYGVLVGGLSCSPMIDRLTLFPTTGAIDTSAERRTIAWGDGRMIEVWVLRTRPDSREPAEGFVLVFTGNASRAERVIEGKGREWDGQDLEIWAVNYPGYGRSDGPARLKSIARSSLEVYDAMRREAGERPIYLDGTSMGTTAALCVAGRREDVAGLVLKNPPPLAQLIRGEFGWWNLWLLAGPISLAVPGELDSLANARRSKAPALFIISGRDRVVPYAYQKRVLEAYVGPTTVIERTRSDHNDPLSPDELNQMKNTLTQWPGRDE